MTVTVNRWQLDYFRRIARNTTKRINGKDEVVEIYAVLLGRRTGLYNVEVTQFMYPELESQTTGEVTPDDESLKDIEEQARELGVEVLGSIHSHPNYAPIMSKTDFKWARHDGELVSGIVEVTNRKTRVAFWILDSALHCDLKYRN